MLIARWGNRQANRFGFEQFLLITVQIDQFGAECIPRHAEQASHLHYVSAGLLRCHIQHHLVETLDHLGVDAFRPIADEVFERRSKVVMG